MSKRQVQRGRFSARRKLEAVLRLLRGEELDGLSRELGGAGQGVGGGYSTVDLQDNRT